MAKTTITGKSTQATTTTATGLGNKLLGKADRGGVVQAFPFTYTNSTGGTLADGSYIQLCTVGPGRVLPTSVFTTTALGSSRVLNIGTQEYVNTAKTTVAASANALVAAADVSSAVVNKTFGAVTTDGAAGAGYDIAGPCDILAQVTGGTIPNGAVIRGVIFMVQT